MAIAGGRLNLGDRVPPPIYHNQDSALANSLLSQQANGCPPPFGHQYPFSTHEDFPSLQSQHLSAYDDGPGIEAAFPTSHPGSKYGSPRDDIRLPLSPVGHLSTLDVPLPASFDSQGISFYAKDAKKNIPLAASVPSKFGLESPPPSLPHKAPHPSIALRNLHDSAFGMEPRAKAAHMGSSPPPITDDYTGQRVMHSQRLSKPKMISSSVPRPGASEDWDNNFNSFEEDWLPGSLHDLLTPQEKARRLSRSEQDMSGSREPLSGVATPGDSSSKVGSPPSASPSRFGALFARQRQQEDSSPFPTSAFGHIGSPLRNSSLHPGASPSLRAVSRPTSGDVSPFVSSPPRQSSMSGISQQLQRMRIARVEPTESSPGLHPGSARHPSNTRLDRAVSSSSVGTSRIDEEQGDFVFSMEEEDDAKRIGGGWAYPAGGRSPHLGGIGAGRNGTSTAEAKDDKEFLKGMGSFYPTKHQA
ncbi:hypothetical protein MMC16_001334 [Acarospora aff. strigata]|nr:hypothetical protein [Acarospora aff. strigata]